MTPPDRNWTTKAFTEVHDHFDPETGDFTGATETLGATITDHDRHVTYRATIGRGPSGVWLTSLSVQPLDGSALDRPMLRRVPVEKIADAAALAHAREAVLWAHDVDEPEGEEVPVITPGHVPSSEQVEQMLKAGETRHTIAAKFYRSPSTVSDWISRAYRERPDTMPERRRPGRRPTQTPGGNRQPGNPKKK